MFDAATRAPRRRVAPFVLCLALAMGVAAPLAGCRQEAPAAARAAPPIGTEAPDRRAALPQVNPVLVKRGEELYADHGCGGCHKIDGVGADVGPDLSTEGLRRPDIAWQIEHLKDPTKSNPGSGMPGFPDLKPDELEALAAYLVTRR